MKTDFKFWYVRRDDAGFIEEAAIRFFEGQVNTQDELVDGELKAVTRYRRSKRLSKRSLGHLNKVTRKELSGADAVIYTAEDFGQIQTDDELVTFLKGEIKKDPRRTPIDELE